MTNTEWILVANASGARLFRRERAGLAALGTFQHPQSRQRSSALGDDKAGREKSGRGFGGAAFEPRVDAQHKEHLHFARELGDLLEAGALDGSYSALRVFACSPFLGELKQALGPAAQRLLAGVHDVDLTHVGPAELAGRIQEESARSS